MTDDIARVNKVVEQEAQLLLW